MWRLLTNVGRRVGCRKRGVSRVHLETAGYPPSPVWADVPTIVGTWLSLVERTLGVGEVASSNLVVPTIYSIIFNKLGEQFWVHLAK
jgi:hypothetical protein